MLEDLSHQAAKLWEEVNRLYNNSKTEKEMDQIPFKTVQLQQALTPSCMCTEKGHRQHTYACQARNGDIQDGEGWELMSSSTRWMVPQGPGSKQEQRVLSKWACGLAQPKYHGRASSMGQRRVSGEKLPAAGADMPLLTQPVTWQDLLLAKGLGPQYHKEAVTEASSQPLKLLHPAALLLHEHHRYSQGRETSSKQAWQHCLGWQHSRGLVARWYHPAGDGEGIKEQMSPKDHQVVLHAVLALWSHSDHGDKFTQLECCHGWIQVLYERHTGMVRLENCPLREIAAGICGALT